MNTNFFFPPTMFKCPMYVNIRSVCRKFSPRFMIGFVARKIGNLFSKDVLFNVSRNISELKLVNIGVSGYCLFILGHLLSAVFVHV